MLREVEHFCRQRRSVFYPKTDLPLPALAVPAHADKESATDPGIHHLLAEVCARLFPRQLQSICPLTEQGTLHRLYRALLLNGRSLIVRVNALSRGHHDFALHLDRWAMARIREAGLPALEVYEVDTSRRVHAYDYEVLEAAKGVSLRAFDHDEALLQPLLVELGRTVARLHEIPTEGFGLLDVRPMVLSEKGSEIGHGSVGTWDNYLQLNLAEHTETCLDIRAINPDEARRILTVFESLVDLSNGVRPALLHGDLGNHNIFTDGTSITALIDWEDCLSGDPVFDIAFWATFHPERRYTAFIAGYRSVRTLPDDFELRFWLYFLRISLSKTVLRHRFGLREKPGRPPASERIQKSLSRLERLLKMAKAA